MLGGVLTPARPGQALVKERPGDHSDSLGSNGSRQAALTDLKPGIPQDVRAYPP